MRFYLFLCTFIFFTILSTRSYSQKGDKVKLIVEDEAGQPLPKAIVIVDENNRCTTNKSGHCSFVPVRKLKMPFNVTMERNGYEIKEFTYYDEDKELEVVVRKAVNKDYTYVYVLHEDKSPFANLPIKIQFADYTTDIHGLVKVPLKDVNAGQVKIKGYDLVASETKGKALFLTIKIHEEKKLDSLQLSDLLNQNLSQKELEELVFNQYKSDFEAVTSAILAERHRLEEDNEEIREDINAITRKLQMEKNLTKEHRRELETYIEKLEKTLNENTIAFKKTEEKTIILMEKLRRIILEKDSVNLVNIKRFQLSEEQRIAAEKRSRRNLIVFSVVGLSLLLLALIFYFIAIKFRRQKNSLAMYNQELIVLKDELGKRVHEVNTQKDLIEEQNKELDLFVYKASHDIKGPLKSLLGLTNIGMKTISDKNSLEIFDHIHKSISKLDRLLADLLQLSKAKSASVSKTKINPRENVQEVIESFKNATGFNNVDIQVDIPDNYELYTDKNLFYSILQNFVENAIKYYDPAKEKSYLKIKLEENENTVLMRFEDNGLGISEENLSKVFDMFYKVNEASNGTGLGLYLVKYNVEKLGGKLKVESALGKGSVFTIEFTKELSNSVVEIS